MFSTKYPCLQIKIVKKGKNKKKKDGEYMETFVALHRNHFGEIISFVTSEGRVISYQKALMEVENGTIEGIQAQENPDGSVHLIPETEQSFDQFPDLF